MLALGASRARGAGGWARKALSGSGTAWARGAQAGARAGIGPTGRQRERGRAEQATAGLRGARQAGHAAGRRWALGARAAWELGAQPGRAGWPGLCTRCTQPVFGPIRLNTIPESLNEHCLSKKKILEKKI